MNYKVKVETYTRTDSGKNWKSKPDETEESMLTEERYTNCTSPDTVRFFRRLGGFEKAVKGYTSQGYITVKSVSISPDRTIKKVRRFEVIDS